MWFQFLPPKIYAIHTIASIISTWMYFDPVKVVIVYDGLLEKIIHLKVYVRLSMNIM